jgi:hypothetical protein
MMIHEDQSYWLLVVMGTVLATGFALALSRYEEEASGPASLVAIICLGFFHQCFMAAAFVLIGGAFTRHAAGKIDDFTAAICIFDFAVLTVPLTRGSNSVIHAVIFAASGWVLGYIYYGMAQDLSASGVRRLLRWL